MGEGEGRNKFVWSLLLPPEAQHLTTAPGTSIETWKQRGEALLLRSCQLSLPSTIH